MTGARVALVRRGIVLNYTTLGYNCLAALWRLHSDSDPSRRIRAERMALRTIGVLFLGLAAFVMADAVQALLDRTPPDTSVVGIVLAGLSLIVMPVLARAKRRVAFTLGSGAVAAEAQQTMFCTYLSAILLVGLLLNAAVGWWWADPVAALVMVPLLVREGIEGVRGRSACHCC